MLPLWSWRDCRVSALQHPGNRQLYCKRGRPDALAREGRCCISRTPEVSLCESMRLHGLYEQIIAGPLSHDVLVQLQRIASETRFPADLGR